MFFYYVLSIVAALFTSIGQVLLKKYALTKASSFLKKITNFYLLSSVISFMSAFLIAIFVMRILDFTIYYALTALNFVFISILSTIFLDEKLDGLKIGGVLIIVIGLIIFNL